MSRIVSDELYASIQSLLGKLVNGVFGSQAREAFNALGSAPQPPVPTANVCMACGCGFSAHSPEVHWCPSQGKSTSMWATTTWTPFTPPTKKTQVPNWEALNQVYWSVRVPDGTDLPQSHIARMKAVQEYVVKSIEDQK